MLLTLMKSKIHGATVTEANLLYTGSITIDKDLLRASGMLAFERVQIVNLNNGVRVETYILEGPSKSGVICMNGAAARWAQVGDKVIIICYAHMSASEAKKHKPVVIFPDAQNRLRRTSGGRR